MVYFKVFFKKRGKIYKAMVSKETSKTYWQHASVDFNFFSLSV